MRATTACLAKGFFGRSLDEFKRLSNIAFKLEGIKGPSGPMAMHSFEQPDSVDDCKVMTDQDTGGFSSASLDWVPASPATATPAHARFHGTISTKLPEGKDRDKVMRTGYAAFRTRDRPATLFGRSLWDIDMYSYLALRIKTPAPSPPSPSPSPNSPASTSNNSGSSSRSFLVNLQTDSVVPTDLHQHRLFAKRPGQWETVLIAWNDFVRTNHGKVVEPQTEMLRRKVKSVGIGLTDRVPGPFELCIARVWATNDVRDAAEPTTTTTTTMQEPQPQQQQIDPALVGRGGRLRNKDGQHIQWH
ncbi:CIA30-domain-containing protein [Xylariomycetidae sp. FL0641]|nr:CIA30-domain-containing protein [Xylariomycetidae sp. FL0641]